MKLYSDTLTAEQLREIAAAHGIDAQIGDDFHGTRARRASVVLRPGPGMSDDYRTFGQSGRRVHACSWEGHYVVMAGWFDADPAARIVSALATWNGREDFYARAGARVDTYGGGTLNCHTFGDGDAPTMADYQSEYTHMTDAERREAIAAWEPGRMAS